MVFSVDTKRGKGAHFRVRLGDRITTVQSDLNPGRIERILKQLNIAPADL
jgi:predicted RNA binding protein YcfA (HicA-like mRNA interferase family)